MELTGYTIPQNSIIDYPPELLRTFYIDGYEWIDYLHFGRKVEEFIDNPEEYLKVAKEIFLEAGWNGDGLIQLMWMPPFMFDGVHSGLFTNGIVIWHVKQESDGISWIISPINLFTLNKTRIVFERDETRIKEYSIELAKKYDEKITYVK